MAAENVFDIINTDAFSLASMIARFDTIEFTPGQATQLPIWNVESVNTRFGMIELRDQMLTLVEPSQRGAAGSQIQDQNRALKAFEIPHFQQNGRVNADEVVGVREFGTTNTFQTVESKVQRKLMIAENNFSGTEEYMAVTALQGTTKSGAGTTILDAYTLLGQTKKTNIFGANNTFDITASNSANASNSDADSRLRTKCHKIVRAMRDDIRMGGVLPRVWCFAGKDWMDAFTSSIEVKTSFARFTEVASIGQVGAFLREGAFYGVPPFYYGGIWFEEYRGSGVPAAEAIFFPILPSGTQPFYDVYYAPADYLETVNTLGRPRYAKVVPDPSGYNKFIEVETQFNAVYLCRRPLALYTCDKS